MDEQQGAKPVVKPKRIPPSRKGKGPTPSSWKPGQSGNPRGRPRAGLAFAERVRERVDPDMVIELAMRVASDESLSPQERLIALWPLIDRGYVKPPAGLDLNVSREQDEPSLEHLSTERLRELLAEIDGGPALTDGSANRALPTTIDVGTPEPGH